ncbi:MAG: hypothetical protein QCH35_04940 [Methanomicrobiaceae archaeon]|nr:hypothetical protein [Methanomicrobiaceae archaeon]
MMQKGAIDLTKDTKEAYLTQARARLDEIRHLQAGIVGQKEDAPVEVQEDLDACAIDIQRYILRAEDQMELLGHADENEWTGMREEVDETIGEAQREVERAHELLSNPMAGKRPEREYSEL